MADMTTRCVHCGGLASKCGGKTYISYYLCHGEWSSEWCCACNDRCPVCNAEIEPFAAEELPNG